MEWEVSPPLKNFQPRCSNLPILDDYGVGDLGEEYWASWNKKPYVPKKGSIVDHEALMRAAKRLNYPDMSKVQYICDFLKEGASLGIQGEGRWPSAGRNNSSVLDYGARVADSLQGGIEDGYLCGPLTREEVDKIWPEGVKVSPMMVRLKPNGSARIIMDMSWPKKVKLGVGKACSLNEGMKNFAEYR